MSDTIDLLKTCDKGALAAIDAIDEVLDRVRGEGLKERLLAYKEEYCGLLSEIDAALGSHGIDGDEQSGFMKNVAAIKTDMKLAFGGSDEKIADIMTDGCNSGAKAVNKKINEFDDAAPETKDIAKRLIRLMDRQQKDMRKYL